MTVLPDDGLSLAAEFPDATHEQWRRLVEGVLRKAGKDVSGQAAEDALSTTLEDGLTTRPLYTAPDAPDAFGDRVGLPGFAPFTRGGAPAGGVLGGWDVRQRHARPDAARANEAVLADLENGVTSLWLVLGDAGLPVSALGAALDGVYLDLAPVVLDAGADFEAAGQALLALYDERGVARRAARGNLGADPSATSPAPVTPTRSPRTPPPPRGWHAGPTSSTRAARADRGRPAVPRGGRLGRRGTRRLPGHRRGLPAGAHRGRTAGRRGLRSAGVPLRRHRRPVPDDRQAARRAPAVGPRRAGVRRDRGGGAAPARRHLAGDDDPP